MAKTRVCPVENAKGLDNFIRKWAHNPGRILRAYVKEGMTVLDIGCGPGLFSVEMAKMVGKTGKVIAADLQQGMLEKLKKKIHGTEIEKQIQLHKCGKDNIGIHQKVDFILAFYMVHEVPDQDRFLKQVKSLLNPRGKIMIIEPGFHVSKKAFAETLKKAIAIGLKPVTKPKVFFSRTMVLEKER